MVDELSLNTAYKQFVNYSMVASYLVVYFLISQAQGSGSVLPCLRTLPCKDRIALGECNTVLSAYTLYCLARGHFHVKIA